MKHGTEHLQEKAVDVHDEGHVDPVHIGRQCAQDGLCHLAVPHG